MLFRSGYSTTIANNTETWNGSAWSEVAELNAGRDSIGGGAISTSNGLAFGGQAPSTTSATESYNGTSWTEVSELNTARYGLAGTGDNTGAVGFGSSTNSPYAITESWNGSSWTEVGDLSTGRGSGIAAGGTRLAAFAAGGWTGSSRTNATEEFTSPSSLQNKTITSS